MSVHSEISYLISSGLHMSLKKIRKMHNIYNWKSVKKIHDTEGYNIVVELRNPEQIVQTEEVPLGEFECKMVKKNIYNGTVYEGWEVSGVYVYSNDKGFVGDVDDSLKLYNNNIIPEKSSPENPYSQIGFSEKEQTWYAWTNSSISKLVPFSIGTESTYGLEIFSPANELDLVKHIQAMFDDWDGMIATIESLYKD